MVLGGAFFTPFIEAPTVRASFPTSHISGSYTADIDPLRQGVEIANDKQRYAGTLPKLGTGDNDHELSLTVFGQPFEFREEEPFEEIAKFDPVVYMSNTASLMFPIVLGNASFLDPERFGGFIEPLGIGSRGFILETAEFEAHTVRAHIQDGNEDSFAKTDRIVQTFRIAVSASLGDLYIDATDIMGASASGSIILVGVFPESEKMIDPFNESISPSRSFLSSAIDSVGPADIVQALLRMTGAASDEYVPDGDRSMGTGFTYDLNVRGTDSLAFGGLLRS